MGSCGKSCRLGLFRICASIFLLAGVILILIGLSSSALFASLLRGKDVRRVDIFFGVFRSLLIVEYGNGTMINNMFWTKFSDIDEWNWVGAQALSIMSIVTGLAVLTLHFLLVFANLLRKWYIILVELLLMLFVVSFLIAGIALVETQLYSLNAYGDQFLLKLLRRHDLLRYTTGGPLDRNFRGPMHTYWILVAADFCFLVSLLCCLPEFIYVVDQRRKRKREEKYPEPMRL